MKCPDNRNYYQQGECEISAGASVVTCDSQIEFPEIFVNIIIFNYL